MDIKFTEKDMTIESIDNDENAFVDDLLGKLQSEIKQWCKDMDIHHPRLKNVKYIIAKRVGELLADGNF